MNNIKKLLRTALLFFILAGASFPAYASISEGDEPWTRPQIGLWFGPVTPVGPLWDKLNPYLGGGAYTRLPVFEYGTIGADISYQEQPSNGTNHLDVVPMYGNFIFKLPINFPISFSLKAGAGSAWVMLRPQYRSQYDPLFMAGFEVSFPAGSVVNIGMRIDYLYLYETWQTRAQHDGYFINAGLTLYFNLDIL
jgi:hypothetical protein